MSGQKTRKGGIALGIPVLILGESGSGKSASLRNFKPGEILIFNVANKPLPFREKLDCLDKSGYRAIFEEFKAQKYKRYVVDDSQYLLAFESFAKAKENGYQKFTDMALHFYSLIKTVTEGLPDDTVVYFLHHVQKTDYGIKAKTIGKMLAIRRCFYLVPIVYWLHCYVPPKICLIFF
nr:MAG TPA: ClpB protein [Caudoviricetes sp.]